jgi:osmotically-inducible protein OsmY
MREEYLKGRLKKAAVIITTMAVMNLLVSIPMPAIAAKPRLSDISISDAVEDQLLMDNAVSSHLINVTTLDGIVTLSGSVDNILSKERSARIAKIVKGVRAVVNRISVNPPILRTDGLIREDVEEGLLADPATDSYEVAVSVDDNRVTLAGTVDSWQERELCEKVAKGVKGVKAVNNEIKVSWPTTRSDYEIKADVEKTLEWDAFVDHALINVEVKEGNVMLSGIVGSAAEKSEAGYDAHMQGVKSVDVSGLKVERWARDKDLKGEKYVTRTEKEIEDALKDALFYDPRIISSFKIVPEVTDATVTLRGTVDNLKAKRAAARDARNTVGVISVVNRIKVRPRLMLSDEKIEEKVERAVIRDPYLESYKITVDVVNGVADLYGTVDSYFDKLQADDVVSKVNGVIMVDNNLIVQDNGYPYTYDPYVDETFINDESRYDHRPRFPAKRDGRIKADIENELFWSPFVDADDVNVKVNDGRVTLSGIVDSWSEYNAAANNAYEGGAVYVKNDLTVK